ncbi:MAG: OsmC family peroxiredoxin [Leeuwenhoekiella sp.]|nr:MAG: OsmC family peroxiredoxin [Leeuwenhoekiella sp.]
MKFIRNASATWKGRIKAGMGTISTESGVLDAAKYGFATRFEDGKGTNPEELIGAAHAGCYTMQLSAFLGEEDYNPENLHTEAKVTFEDGAVTKVHLTLTGKVPECSEDEFLKLANKAKENCPISKLLKAEITLDATLES